MVGAGSRGRACLCFFQKRLLNKEDAWTKKEKKKDELQLWAQTRLFSRRASGGFGDERIFSSNDAALVNDLGRRRKKTKSWTRWNTPYCRWVCLTSSLLSIRAMLDHLPCRAPVRWLAAASQTWINVWLQFTMAYLDSETTVVLFSLPYTYIFFCPPLVNHCLFLFFNQMSITTCLYGTGII